MGTVKVTELKLPDESVTIAVGDVVGSNPPNVNLIFDVGIKLLPLTVTVAPVTPLKGDTVIVGVTLNGLPDAQPKRLVK